jgi:hypothetical protein
MENLTRNTSVLQGTMPARIGDIELLCYRAETVAGKSIVLAGKSQGVKDRGER